MARVIDLTPGDEIRAPISFGDEVPRKHPIFLYKLPHPVAKYNEANLYLVVWLLPDDSLSFDTLSPLQDVGDIMPAMSVERRERNLELFWNAKFVRIYAKKTVQR